MNSNHLKLNKTALKFIFYEAAFSCLCLAPSSPRRPDKDPSISVARALPDYTRGKVTTSYVPKLFAKILTRAAEFVTSRVAPLRSFLLLLSSSV